MRLMRSFLLISTLAAAGCASPAWGAPPGSGHLVLVELFTSQGCSSCPPADAFVRELPRLGFDRDKVVPLTFHVDYWDRLGWPDPFASPVFTARQQWYARSGRLRSPGGEGRGALAGLYTPQMIVDGQIQFPGGHGQVATTELRRAGARPAPVDLAARASVEGDEATVTVGMTARSNLDRAGDWRLVGALAATHARTRVLHGENAGETLEEAAVVRALSDRVPVAVPAAGATAAPPSRLKLRKPADLAWGDVELVTFLQSEKTLEVAGVARLANVGAR